MGLKEKYFIKSISYKDAIDIVIEKHYLHRRCPVSHAYGLIEKVSGEIMGVVTYGVSPSSTLLKGICGPEEAKNVYELNRLWVDDRVSKNGESFLIANSMKYLDREIVVSFADTSQGHLGVVYQAANFMYTGLSTKFKDPKVVGKENMHHATYANGLTNAQVIEKFGVENVTFVERPRKHRYIYFNCSATKRKKLVNKLRYKIIEYPKNQTQQ